MAQLLNGMTTRTLQAIWRDRCHGQFLQRMQAICAKEGVSLFSEGFATAYLDGCVTREFLHHVFSGRKRFSPDRCKVIHDRLTKTERKLGLPPANLIKWWEVRG